MVSLDIFSDPICPWCLIGRTRLMRAIAERPGHGLSLAWRPYMLNPDMPREGVDRQAYLEAKFGGPEGARRVYGAIADAAAADGLAIDFEAITRTPSTLDAHRLVGWARDEGRDDALTARLFAAYFQEGRDIGDRNTLSALAGECGMDADRASARLATGEDVEATLRDADAARRHGVSGVPAFLIGGRRWIAGAQPTAFWIAAIDALSQRRAAAG
ncbi:DsbA family oxidoreductase [Rubrimonas cliftonensis]|uniref:Predicted dithiol-disulfide isomerase, DsbA family n=1 Tax=Rubrimonas cliftonensis TaxID=89524 RepID=A0A1H3W5V2_9RHOB|nr:DsbA family oxidoreductase [Rubrimonas cliftonensis]SDZ82221.1 Predicted dithiol-disulfide isomerase, DsbA family [Rubrimonas cliftonensis]